jgi:D-aminoacyl-tRNA deacylase
VRVVLQRVSEASVTIEGRVAGRIGRGLLLLVGFTEGDTEDDLSWMADKVVGLRIFNDPDGKMNLSLDEAGGGGSAEEGDATGEGGAPGGILVVSQFTLYGDTRKGRRPSFVKAAHPDLAIPLYDRFVALLRERAPGPVETGEFGAMMDVALVNDGPVTLVLERGPAGGEDADGDPRRGG